MIENTTAFRSKDQVLHDLSVALQFSPESLEDNRKGRLSMEQAKNLSGRVLQPAILAFAFAAAPFAILTSMAAGRLQIPFTAALPALLTELIHAKDLFETHGKFGGGVMILFILIGLGGAAFMASRVSLPLYFDLLQRSVEAREGRVVAREEQTMRANGRDPIENYFFTLRHLKVQVNYATYRALEDGSLYVLYLLPRSELLASMEPKVENAPPVLTSTQKSSQS